MLAIAEICADKLAVLRLAQDRNLHKLTKNQTITNKVYLSTFLQTHARFCIEDLKVIIRLVRKNTSRMSCWRKQMPNNIQGDEIMSLIGPSQHQNLMTSLTEKRLR